jgi:hypothetical protein
MPIRGVGPSGLQCRIERRQQIRGIALAPVANVAGGKLVAIAARGP